VAAVLAIAAVTVGLYFVLAPEEAVPPPQPTAPAPPANVQGVAGDGNVTVSWDAVEGATSYNLYMASEPGVTKDTYAGKPDGAVYENIASPYTRSGLTNGVTYYARATALNAAGESAESAEVSVTPTAEIPVTPPAPLYVTGLVEVDSGAIAGGAEVTVRAEDGSATTGTTGNDGRFNLGLNPQFPARVLVEVTHRMSGLPPVTGFRWSPIMEDGGAVDVGRVVLPDPKNKQLTIVGNTASSSDGSVFVSGFPSEVASLWARSYDPDARPDVFPGDLAEGRNVPFNSVVFLWIAALDADDDLIVDVDPPATVRMKVPTTQWVDLEDLQPGNGVIDTPIYSLDYATGYWEREGDGWLTDAAGSIITEDQEDAIRQGLYAGEVFAEFLADHFSWWNVDKPPSGCGLDFGDAPDPTYPSLLSSDGARHLDICRAWLGAWADEEDDAEVPDLDLYDDGLVAPDPIKVKVSNWDWASTLYLNILIDKNDDGDWEDPGEWAVQNLAMSVPKGKFGYVETDTTWDGQSWIRITLTGAPISNYDGTGQFKIGETEDYPFWEYTLHLTVWGNGTVTSDPPGIDCRKGSQTGCHAQFKAGTIVDLTATPDPGESFIGWGGDCQSFGANQTCTLTMDSDGWVGATFTQPFYDLSVDVWGNGRVTSIPPGIDCRRENATYKNCTAVFPRGSNVTLTATPDPGDVFLSWGGDCQSFGSNQTCTLTMNGNKWASAQFSQPWMLHMYGGGNSTGWGTVTSDPPGIDCQYQENFTVGNCTAEFPHGTEVNLTATPDPGYTFLDWMGSCSGTNPVCTLTMDSDKWVVARFV
jgi:hypothetical protein